MDGTGGQYELLDLMLKDIKETERQIMPDITYMWNPLSLTKTKLQSNTEKWKTKLWLSGMEVGWRKWGDLEEIHRMTPNEQHITGGCKLVIAHCIQDRKLWIFQ